MKINFKKTGLLAGLFFILCHPSFATTFGPIPVVDQALNAQYFVRAYILGSSWTKMEPNLKRPYTYWKISIREQPIGKNIGNEITVRQPGGEIGETGYHVAGVAEFAAGEDVFLPLHDTDEPDQSIKEVVGLASGKYRVETGRDGKQTVVSGLGIPITGSGGRLFSPEEFSALLHRINRNEISEEDKNVFVSRKSTNDHQDGIQAEAREREVRSLMQRSPADANSAKTAAATSVETTVDPDHSGPKSIQESQVESEEPSTGSSVGSWVFAAIVVLGLLVGLVLILRR